MFGFLGQIVGVLGKVVGVAGAVLKIAKPIVYALRDAVPEVGRALGFIETALEAGAAEADDIIDRNMPSILALEKVSGRGVVVMQQLNLLAVDLRKFSQEQSPDTITEEEAAVLIARLKIVVEQVAEWGPELNDAALLIEATE